MKETGAWGALTEWNLLRVSADSTLATDVGQTGGHGRPTSLEASRADSWNMLLGVLPALLQPCGLAALSLCLQFTFHRDVWSPLGSPQPWTWSVLSCATSFRLPYASGSKIYVFTQNPGLQASPSSTLVSPPSASPPARLQVQTPGHLPPPSASVIHLLLLPLARVRALIWEPPALTGTPSRARLYCCRRVSYATWSFWAPEDQSVSGPLTLVMRSLQHVALKGKALRLHFLLPSS